MIINNLIELNVTLIKQINEMNLLLLHNRFRRYLNGLNKFSSYSCANSMRDKCPETVCQKQEINFFFFDNVKGEFQLKLVYIFLIRIIIN